LVLIQVQFWRTRFFALEYYLCQRPTQAADEWSREYQEETGCVELRRFEREHKESSCDEQHDE